MTFVGGNGKSLHVTRSYLGPGYWHCVLFNGDSPAPHVASTVAVRGQNCACQNCLGRGHLFFCDSSGSHGQSGGPVSPADLIYGQPTKTSAA